MALRQVSLEEYGKVMDKFDGNINWTHPKKAGSNFVRNMDIIILNDTDAHKVIGRIDKTSGTDVHFLEEWFISDHT